MNLTSEICAFNCKAGTTSMISRREPEVITTDDFPGNLLLNYKFRRYARNANAMHAAYPKYVQSLNRPSN